MSLDRWDPFREMTMLRDAMDRILPQGLMRPGSMLAGFGSGGPTVDLVETDQEFVLKASMPGVRPEDVQVTVNGDALTLRGDVKGEEERKDQNWLIREHRTESFQRTISLPSAIDVDRAQARSEHGVLTLRLPKAQATPPRRIPIASGSGTGSAAGGGSGTSSQPFAAGQGGMRAPVAHESKTGPVTEATRSGGGDMVSEASEDSFPASDPPSWTPEKA